MQRSLGIFALLLLTFSLGVAEEATLSTSSLQTSTATMPLLPEFNTTPPPDWLAHNTSIWFHARPRPPYFLLPTSGDPFPYSHVNGNTLLNSTSQNNAATPWRVVRRPRIVAPPPPGTMLTETFSPQDTTTATTRVIRRPRIMAPPPEAAPPSPEELKASLEVLAQITLPPNPTRQDVRKYLDQIFDATHPKRPLFPSDPQVNLILRIGRENVPTLLESLPLRSAYSYYATLALKQLAGDEHKQLIIDHLETNPELITIIAYKGWEKEAAPILKLRLHEIAQSQFIYLSEEWVCAAARLHDPSTYDDIKTYIATSFCSPEAYRSIEINLPDLNLDESIQTAWRRVYHQDPLSYFTLIAAAHGVAEAVPILFTNLHVSGLSALSREAILKLTDAKGSNSELLEWYDTHKDKLKFNPVVRRYEVVEK